MSEEKPKKVNTMRVVALLHTAAIVKALLIYCGYKLGLILDGHFGTYPYLMITCVFVMGLFGLGWVIFAFSYYMK